MSPVNRFDEEGLPLFYIKDIPPASTMELRIDRPELYFGEQTDTYVVVAGGTTEFDYPKGRRTCTPPTKVGMVIIEQYLAASVVCLVLR